MSTALMEIDTKIVDQDVQAIVVKAQEFEIETNEDLQAAGKIMQTIKGLEKAVDDTFNGPTKAAHAAHKAIKDAWTQHRAPLEAAERLLKVKTGAYLQAEEQKRIAAQQEAEAQARAEEARRKAEIAAMKKEGATKAEVAAVKAAPIVVNLPPPLPPPMVKGVSSQVVWKYRITDTLAIPREYLQVDEVKIGKIVRAMKGETRIAGVEVFSEKQVAVRA